jgi:hypothetical protein
MTCFMPIRKKKIQTNKVHGLGLPSPGMINLFFLGHVCLGWKARPTPRLYIYIYQFI